jgi:hypothetical protein
VLEIQGKTAKSIMILWILSFLSQSLIEQGEKVV